uniref:Immunoglobulin superfamily, member 10 n=1 Tax=Sinocyclocheilus grahami TaxID=75366 RepID=A0A672NJ30_SINGR
MPEISWGLPDGTLVNSGLQADGSEGDQFKQYTLFNNGTLYLNKVGSDEEGDYTCYAENKLGKDKMHVHISVVTAVPIFNNPFNERVVTRVGRTAVLNCSADGQPMPEMIWTLPNRTRFSGTPGFKGSRYHLGTDGTFAMYNSSIEDTGKYRCAAKNKVGYIEKLVIFEVIQKPYILTRPKGIIQGISGQSLFLHCLTDGIQPSISWTMPGGFVLTVIHDRGNYVCRAKNDAGEAVLSVPVVIIAYPPRITNGPPPTVRGVAGVPVYLNCVANGIPTPAINWEPVGSDVKVWFNRQNMDITVCYLGGKQRTVRNSVFEIY